MDPNANMEEQNRIVARMRAGTADADDVERLQELRDALREWLARGGFPPTVPPLTIGGEP